MFRILVVWKLKAVEQIEANINENKLYLYYIYRKYPFRNFIYLHQLAIWKLIYMLFLYIFLFSNYKIYKILHNEVIKFNMRKNFFIKNIPGLMSKIEKNIYL